eukprot:TRINITY_DN5480_c0_g1_i1.p1 TRINITY_DN5480_c0_g1~~TRINITY_DN5480_c0_g1_i1.p1  ORF type:complete len:274 (-),score=63.90 TRINITY_DN5480_c0_g1_i1:242-1063(-)
MGKSKKPKTATTTQQSDEATSSHAPIAQSSIPSTVVAQENASFESPTEMWKEQLATGRDGWYSVATDYWKERPATVDGMLGGYGHISQEDIRGSSRFLESFTKSDSSRRVQLGTAIDCGAGVGRTTKNFLAKYFQKVDLVEQSAEFLAKAKEWIGADPRVENYFCSGLQDFTPIPGRYNVIWIQWVLLYLTDDDLIAFMKRCKIGLAHGGLIFVKENVSKDSSYTLDKEDNSITRSDPHYRDLFQRAGLKLVRSQQQQRFPRELFPVFMYALE